MRAAVKRHCFSRRMTMSSSGPARQGYDEKCRSTRSGRLQLMGRQSCATLASRLLMLHGLVQADRRTKLNGGTVIATAVLVVCTLGTPGRVNGQGVEIGIIDLYGLSRVSAHQIRETLTFAEGDTLTFETAKGQRS